jgi:hypothetical protein
MPGEETRQEAGKASISKTYSGKYWSYSELLIFGISWFEKSQIQGRGTFYIFLQNISIESGKRIIHIIR